MVGMRIYEDTHYYSEMFTQATIYSKLPTRH